MGVSEDQAIGPTGIWLGDHLPHRYSPDLVNAVLQVLGACPESVCDLGCGEGRYLLDFAKHGCAVWGVEGTKYIAPAALREVIATADLTTPLDLEPADLTLCIEVGEHIPAPVMFHFLENVKRSTRNWLVLSWAIPGQTGFGHVNCQSNETVIAWLDDLGFAHDAERTSQLRDLLRNDCQRYLPNTIMVFDKR